MKPLILLFKNSMILVKTTEDKVENCSFCVDFFVLNAIPLSADGKLSL
jgi:hypothetical protein